MKKLAYKTLLIGIVASLALLALPVGVLADSTEGENENEFTQTVNGYKVTLSFEKPATVGENPIHVQLFDVHNMPVAATALDVNVTQAEAEQGHEQPEAKTASHDDMQGMPGMADEHQAEKPVDDHGAGSMTMLKTGHEGEYKGEVTIKEAGDAVLRVHFTVHGEVTEVDFPVSVARSETGSNLLAVFFAINIAIVGVAFVMKTKSVSVKQIEGSVA